MKLASANPPEIEQFIHKLSEPSILTLNDVERFGRLVRRRSLLQDLNGEAHRREWSTDLMCRDGQEFIAGFQRFLCPAVKARILYRKRSAPCKLFGEFEVSFVVTPRGRCHERQCSDDHSFDDERRRHARQWADRVDDRMTRQRCRMQFDEHRSRGIAGNHEKTTWSTFAQQIDRAAVTEVRNSHMRDTIERWFDIQ